MPAATFNLTEANRLEAGATFDLTIELQHPNGDPVDLSPYDPQVTTGALSGRMRLRKTADATETVLQISPITTEGSPGVYIVQPATSGKIRIIIEALTLETISYSSSTPHADVRSGVYDLETSTGTSTFVPEVVRWIEGAYLISPEVTRPD